AGQAGGARPGSTRDQEERRAGAGGRGRGGPWRRRRPRARAPGGRPRRPPRADARAKLGWNRYDVVVLDRDLPGVHGDQVCRILAGQAAPTRILMLTASGTVDDRVDGLTLGADDYLGKPFAFSELVARLRALARRSRDPLPPVL